MEKILVAYFSASGTTKAAAEKLAEAAGGDIFEIEPQAPYTDADLNWMDSRSRSSVEMKDKAFRPEMKKKALNPQQYDLILLGFPVWWYVAPTIINTFLESYDFSGKTIFLFATSGGSGLGKSAEELAPSAPKALIRDGKMVNGWSAKQMEDWVKSL